MGQYPLVSLESNRTTLQQLNSAIHALEASTSLTDVKGVRDKAEAIRLYAQNARLGLDIQNKAAELRLRAERKAGQLLRSMQLHGGDRKSSEASQRFNLSQLGINQYQSKRWQQEAAVPDDVFTQFVRYATANQKELTAAALLRLAKATESIDQSTARPAKPMPYSAGSGEESPLVSLLDELVEHSQLLCSLLVPVCSDNTPVQLRKCERRMVRRLIDEIQQHAATLQYEMVIRGQVTSDGPRVPSRATPAGLHAGHA